MKGLCMEVGVISYKQSKRILQYGFSWYQSSLLRKMCLFVCLSSRILMLSSVFSQALKLKCQSLNHLKIRLTSSFFLFIYFWQREKDRAWAGEGQRERGTQNLKQAPGSEMSAQSLTRGSNSQTTRSCPEPKLEAQQTEPGPPRRLWAYYHCTFT